MADKFIKLSDALASVDDFPEFFRDLAHERLLSVPAADERPVVRGRWEWNSDNGYYYCSNCDAVSPREDQEGEYCDTPAFCHVCGADMREEART